MGVRREGNGRARKDGGIRREAQIDVEIGELVLEGVARGDRYRIAEAMQQELGRLFQEQGLPAGLENGPDRRSLNRVPCPMTAGMTAEAIGQQLARAIYGGLEQ